jgi:phosphate starvation-inducible protein PhoH and related proteins
MPASKAARTRVWRKSTPKFALPLRSRRNCRAGDFGAPSIKTAAARVARARSPAQGAYLDLMRTHPLVFGVGPAGTGKTYLAAAFGAHLLLRAPGRTADPVAPGARSGRAAGLSCPAISRKRSIPICARFTTRCSTLGEQCVRLMAIRRPSKWRRSPSCAAARWPAPSSFSTRRRTLTPAQMKMFLTRLGEDSRMVVTGDPSQSDLPGGRPEGLNEALRILTDVEGVASRISGQGRRPPPARHRASCAPIWRIHDPSDGRRQA